MSAKNLHFDSGDESEEELIESSTFLGFVDIPISKEEQPELEDSFIGGEPIWLHPDSPPPSDLLLCKHCNSPMHLLLQSSANLENTFYDRTIYVFGCNKPGCRRQKGSVRAIRALRKDPAIIKEREQELIDYQKAQDEKKKKIEEKQKQNQELTKDLFGNTSSPSSNPFGGPSSNPFGTPISNPFDSKPEPPAKSAEPTKPLKPTFAEIAKPKDQPKEQPAKSRKLDIKLPHYPGYILYVDSEVLDSKKQQLPSISTTTSSSAQDVSAPEPTSKPSAENEELAKMLDDSTFQHFTDIISYNTLQVLRYELNGHPLLYSSKDDVSRLFIDPKTDKQRPLALIPNPGYNPSSTRRFELQLMPKAIIDLEVNLESIMDGMEWGTILVGTDVKDYIPDHKYDENHVGYVEEWCGVQWEEEVKRD